MGEDIPGLCSSEPTASHCAHNIKNLSSVRLTYQRVENTSHDTTSRTHHMQWTGLSSEGWSNRTIHQHWRCSLCVMHVIYGITDNALYLHGVSFNDSTVYLHLHYDYITVTVTLR